MAVCCSFCFLRPYHLKDEVTGAKNLVSVARLISLLCFLLDLVDSLGGQLTSSWDPFAFPEVYHVLKHDPSVTAWCLLLLQWVNFDKSQQRRQEETSKSNPGLCKISIALDADKLKLRHQASLYESCMSVTQVSRTWGNSEESGPGAKYHTETLFRILPTSKNNLHVSRQETKKAVLSIKRKIMDDISFRIYLFP